MSHVKKEFQEILDAYWWGKPMDGSGKPSMIPKGNTKPNTSAKTTKPKPNPASIKVQDKTRLPIYVLLCDGVPVSSSLSRHEIEEEYFICKQGEEYEEADGIYHEYRMVEGYIFV